MRMTRRQAARVGDLHEQLRVALSGVPVVEAAPQVRALITRDRVAACEVWWRSGGSIALGGEQRPGMARLCGLPAAVGLSPGLVARALLNAGYQVPASGGQACWETVQHPDDAVTTPWFALALHDPARQASARRRHGHLEPRTPVTIPASNTGPS